MGRLKITVILVFLAITAQAQSLYEYVAEFNADAKTYNVTLYRTPPTIYQDTKDLYVNTIHGDNVRVEAYTDNDLNSIFFDTDSWYYTRQPKVLIYHELGHYYLRRIDDNSLRLDGMPKSIMNTQYIIHWDYLPSPTREYYIRELFGITN